MDGDIACLERDGYVILEGVLDELERALLVAALAPFERERPRGRNAFEGEFSTRVYSLAGKGGLFLALAEHPRITALLDALLAPNWLLSTLQSIRLHPGEARQGWHTDDGFYMPQRPRAMRSGVSTIWALEDFTAENGATEVVPGSHLWGSEHPDDGLHAVVPAIMPAGSVLVFDAGLWHRGGANRSRGTRLCVSPQYCQPWLRPQESQLLIATPEIVRRASPRVQSMLGYSIHPPFVGHVDGMHPLRTIDPSYRHHKTNAAALANAVLPASTR
ncbi:phytanoyl-CoA dioxygenase family protein [Pendulispora rubella]|uniref:Phytanoyl-CoA dioxygenase family protein n=1 Tax=Pendulispora rubella TaxID=2741070 RepID=A0ABZ2L6A7_9BACT